MAAGAGGYPAAMCSRLQGGDVQRGDRRDDELEAGRAPHPGDGGGRDDDDRLARLCHDLAVAHDFVRPAPPDPPASVPRGPGSEQAPGLPTT
jgi:hypothetical protein